MTPKRWQQIEAILQAALDQSAPERALVLNDRCANDLELKTEVSALISAHDEADDFLERPAIERDAHLLLNDESPKPGRAIGPYKLMKSLGSGGMGEVYSAVDTRLNRIVALKILPAYFISDEERLRRFRTEARAASALNHPNILTIYEVGESEELHFIAAEFIDGRTIRELTAQTNLTLGEILDIAFQMISGLAAAHAEGIIHRDIKPENVMRRSDGIVKILDFGIAKLTEPATGGGIADSLAHEIKHTETGLVVGTVGYMSPEQARALGVDERTDIWSSGVVLYEMLARRLPFTGLTSMDTIVVILEREPSPL